MLALTILLLVFVLAGLAWYKKDKLKYKYYPPGPPRLPLLGSLLSIPRTPLPADAFEKLTKIYGDVVHVKMGFVDTIIFNSFETVSAILRENRALGRKQDISGSIKERNLNRNLGVVFGNGETWNVLRPFTIRTLRDFGMGKASSMDVVVNEELEKFVKQLHFQMLANPEGGIQAEEMFATTMTHIMWRMITGIGYELGDPIMERLVKISHAWVRATNTVEDISIAYPFFWNMFPKWSGKEFVVEYIKELHQFMKETIYGRRECEIYKTDPQNFVDVFLANIDKTQDNPSSVFTDDNLMLTLLDLFQAGGGTSSQTLSFCMLYMLLHQNIQEKVFKEIESVVGKQEMITGDMKLRLPYTHASLLETLRLSTVAAFPAPREATEDFWFKGHLIKKGIPLIISIASANYSQSFWGDPYNFRPERFLTKEGSVDVEMAKNIKTFGDGGRACFGRTLAESSLFIYFASLIRTFKISQISGQPEPIVDPVPGGTYSTHPFQAKFIPRY